MGLIYAKQLEIYMKRDTVLIMLKKEIRTKFENDKKLAALHLGISVQHLNRMLNQGNLLCESVLKLVSVKERETEYEKVMK